VSKHGAGIHSHPPRPPQQVEVEVVPEFTIRSPPPPPVRTFPKLGLLEALFATITPVLQIQSKETAIFNEVGRGGSMVSGKKKIEKTRSVFQSAFQESTMR
jgi:hypothetical protein